MFLVFGPIAKYIIMRYWPEISFRYTNSEVHHKENEKVNLFPDQADSGEAINVSTFCYYQIIIVMFDRMLIVK